VNVTDADLASFGFWQDVLWRSLWCIYVESSNGCDGVLGWWRGLWWFAHSWWGTWARSSSNGNSKARGKPTSGQTDDEGTRRLARPMCSGDDPNVQVIPIIHIFLNEW